jgi:hypothetical protein
MRPSRKSERGSLVLVALCFTAVIGIALASYIAVCYRSLDLSTRELHNKRARYLAEVGLEEALWALNNGPIWTSSGPNSNLTWSGTTTRTLQITGYSLGSGATGRLNLEVANATTNNPIVTSTATVTLADGRTFVKTFASTSVQRAVLFGNAVAAASRTNGTVTFNSDGAIDSYYSSSGAWNAATNSGFAAVVAGNNVAFTNADIKGYVATYGAAPSYGSGTVIGSGGSGVDTTRIGTSAFIPLFAVSTTVPAVTTLPGTTAGSTITLSASTPIGTLGSTTYHGTTTTFPNYVMNQSLTVSGTVKMYVRGNLTINSPRRIIVATGSTLELFVAGNVTVGSTTAGFTNTDLTPASLALYLTGASSTLSWASSRTYHGVIYAPNSTASPVMTISNNGARFDGALLANSAITFSGSSPAVHYDMVLRGSSWNTNFGGISVPFVINTLNESNSER